MLVYQDGAICMSCGKKVSLEKLTGKVFDRVTKTTERGGSGQPKISWDKFSDTAELAETAHDILVSFPELKEYLCNRKVESRILPNILGWYLGWYTIPVQDERGNIIGLVLRASPTIEKTSGRYTTPPGQENLVFVPDWFLVKRSSKLFVVFGVFDALALAVLRIPAISPTLGKRIRPEMLERFRSPIYIVPDLGEEREAAELSSSLGWRGRVVNLPYTAKIKDPAGFLEMAQEGILLRTLI